jgi:hypothetical protein
VDRWELYEHCVQSPADVCDLLACAHGGAARKLLEDFCGSAAISREWVRRGGEAVALDADASALALAGNGIEVVCADVRDADVLRGRSFDVIHSGNFSLGYFFERATLVSYLRQRAALLATGGVFACDTYGGRSAFELGAWQRERFLAGGLRVVSTWEHRSADPVTARVENVLHFRVERDGEVVAQLADAFVYLWRLWSLSELRDALREAGFRTVDVYRDKSAPLRAEEKLDPDFSVCVIARR